MTSPVKIGISACLLGEPVRYDGRDKRASAIINGVGSYVTFVPVCPEVGCGLLTPREMMRLEGDPTEPRLMTILTRIDLTYQMQTYCTAKMSELEGEALCGFICKERSPSCGMTAVPLCGDDRSEMFTVGLFARELTKSFPVMPIVEAESLSNANAMKEFIERIFKYHGIVVTG
jgi:uncharacterized protein YbbK (DUF523 family)